MFNNNEIIKQEVDDIIDDIRQVYEQSGKKATGNFGKQLEVNYSNNKAEIQGVEYLAGRASGARPPIADIEAWIRAKGIVPTDISVSSLAFVIARKIGEEGTEGINIYDEVITPTRIQSIMDKITQFNVKEFVDEVNKALKKLK